MQAGVIEEPRHRTDGGVRGGEIVARGMHEQAGTTARSYAAALKPCSNGLEFDPPALKHLVIARSEATKQSRTAQDRPGLLRSARNDDSVWPDQTLTKRPRRVIYKFYLYHILIERIYPS